MKTRMIIFLLLAAVAASAAWLLLWNREADSPVARVSWDGALLEEFDLNQVDEPYTYTFKHESETNTITVERGRVCISEANCPDQICVHQGWISDGTVPIVCLPHTLIVEIVGGGGVLDGGAG